MIEYPKTLVEAQEKVYGQWAGSKGRSYNEGYCASELYSGYIPRQCSRKSGNGPDNLYCKQHAKIVAEGL